MKNKAFYVNDSIIKAVKNIYSVALVANVTDDVFSTLFIKSKRRMPIDLITTKSYSEAYFKIKDLIYQGDIFKYEELYHPDFVAQNIEQKKINGDKALRVKYSDGEYHWISVNMVKMETNKNTSTIIFIFIKNSDREKKVESQIREAIYEMEYKRYIEFQGYKNISHELRTQLSSIRGLADILRNEENISPQNKKRISDILQASDKLKNLLDDIKTMSLLANKECKVKNEIVRLDHLLDELKSTVMPSVLSKKIHFFIDLSELKAESFIGDYDKIYTIIYNLVSNAVKYTREGGNVQVSIVSTETDSGNVAFRYTVKDNGIGMSNEYLKNDIYNIYSTDAMYKSYGDKGVGLGLAVVKNLVSLLGGRLSITSQIGKGTCVVVELENKAFKEMKIETTIEKFGDSFVNVQYSFKGSRLLVVEDNVVNMEIISTILNSANIEVIPAYNGYEAVSIYKKSEKGYFDAIIMDLQMPVMDGYEASQIIRNLARRDAISIPIIAVTAYSYKDDSMNASEYGIDRFVMKPVVPERLFDVLSEYLEKR